MTLVSSLTSMAANVWNYFSIPVEPLWQRAMGEVGYREYLAFQSSVRSDLKSVEEHISNKTILPQTLRIILLKQQEQLDKYISPYFYDKKLKRLQDKAFIDVIKESRARLKEKLAKKPLIAKQSFYNDVINHLIKLSANLDLHVVNADNLADVIQYYQNIIPAEIFDPIRTAIENKPIIDQKNIEAVLKTVNAFFFGDKTENSSVLSNSVEQFRSHSPNLKQLFAALAWSYVGAARAQEMGMEFLKVFGGKRVDTATAIMSTPSNELILGGGITDNISSGYADNFLAKFSANGNRLWLLRFGGSKQDYIKGIAITPTLEIFAGGWTDSVVAGDRDIFLGKFSPNGETIFAKTYGGSSLASMTQGLQSDMFLVGFTQSFGVGLPDVLLIQTDSDGLPILALTIGGNSSDYGRAVIIDPRTNNIIVLADTNSFGAVNRDVLVMILYHNGSLHCSCTFGGDDNDWGADIKVAPNGDIIALGYTRSFGVNWQDILLASISSNCTVNWVKTFGGKNSAGNGDFPKSLHVDPITGNLTVLSLTYSFGTPRGLFLKLGENGTLDSANTFGGWYDYNAFTMPSSEEIYVVGATSSSTTDYDIIFMKLSSNQNSSACGLFTPVNLTVMDWNNFTFADVTSLINITSRTLTVYNWTNMTVQAIVPEEYFNCPNNPLASTSSPSSNNPTLSTSSSSSLASESNVSSTSLAPQTTTTSAPSSSSSSTNPTPSKTSQASNTINFTVQVSQEIILIESEGDPIIILSSTHLSVIGDVDLSNVIYTVSGNMPDWVTIYVDGVIVTQFTQQDVEGSFVSFELNGVGCGDQFSLPLEVNGVTVDADLIFKMDTCSTDNAPRVSDGFLISSKMLPIFGFLARTREQPMRSLECSEAEPGKGFPAFR